MIIFPAIDIKDGNCVRLLQGRAEDLTFYSSDPAAIAKKWIDKGASHIHVVDLDGAFTGLGANLEAVKNICACSSGVPIQLGGGIRDMKALEKRFELGIARAILGTAAILDPGFVSDAAKEFPGRIIAGLDAKDGKIAIKGWVETGNTTPYELAMKLMEVGIETCVFTDISRDGMLHGPNFEAIAKLQEDTGMKVIASGGVSEIGDIERLCSMGIYGAIIGKALYDGRIDLADALKFERGIYELNA